MLYQLSYALKPHYQVSTFRHMDRASKQRHRKLLPLLLAAVEKLETLPDEAKTIRLVLTKLQHIYFWADSFQTPPQRSITGKNDFHAETPWIGAENPRPH